LALSVLRGFLLRLRQVFAHVGNRQQKKRGETSGGGGVSPIFDGEASHGKDEDSISPDFLAPRKSGRNLLYAGKKRSQSPKRGKSIGLCF